MMSDNETHRADTGAIPVLFVSGETLPEAWEKAMLGVWDRGVEVRTEYDADSDRPSLDATVTVEVRKPFAEPRLHKNMPCGPKELEVYRQEVLNGIHDHWIDPRAGKWTYTYHQRLFAYQARQDLQNPDEDVPFGVIDQIDFLVQKLTEAPHSRRAQGITWIPHCDPFTDDPPCLQRVWGRLLPAADDGWVFNFNTHWRSRDLLMAWFMNVFALTDLQRWIAEQISERLGEPVSCGRYVDVSDSLHIYGRCRDEDLEEEIRKMKASPYTDRAWDVSRFADYMQEVREELAEDPDVYAHGDLR
jgi:thymidylate synthase